jgi:hypothetical protein
LPFKKSRVFCQTSLPSQKEQELNSSETGCERVGGLIGGVVKKASFSMVGRGLVKKVSFSSLEMSVVKKSFSAWLHWAKKEENKVKKVVKKLSNISSKFGMILKIGFDFENWVLFENWVRI